MPRHTSISFSFKTKEKQKELVVKSVGYFVFDGHACPVCSDQRGSMDGRRRGRDKNINKHCLLDPRPVDVGVVDMCVYHYHTNCHRGYFLLTLVFLPTSLWAYHCSVILFHFQITCYFMDCTWKKKLNTPFYLYGRQIIDDDSVCWECVCGLLLPYDREHLHQAH